MDFFQTIAGRTFTEHTIPELTKALNRVADGMEEKKATKLGKKISKLIHQDPDKEDGEVIDEIVQLLKENGVNKWER